MEIALSFEAIDNARQVLGLGESATRREIENQYKALLKQYHPDTCTEPRELCLKKTREITEAHTTLCTFTDNYRYVFSREQIEALPDQDAFWKKHFGNDPVWG